MREGTENAYRYILLHRARLIVTYFGVDVASDTLYADFRSTTLKFFAFCDEKSANRRLSSSGNNLCLICGGSSSVNRLFPGEQQVGEIESAGIIEVVAVEEQIMTILKS